MVIDLLLVIWLVGTDVNSRTGRLDEFAKLTAELGMSDLFTSDRRNMSINEAEGNFVSGLKKEKEKINQKI